MPLEPVGVSVPAGSAGGASGRGPAQREFAARRPAPSRPGAVAVAGRSGGQRLPDVAVEAGHGESELAVPDRLDDALVDQAFTGNTQRLGGSLERRGDLRARHRRTAASAMTAMIFFSRSLAAAQRAEYMAVSWSSATGSPAFTSSMSSTTPT